MAKFVGLIGTISGKVGTTVFCKGEKGISYGRAYQPVVANPKTDAQTDRRVIMSLAGRMSQVTPPEVLIGLGRTKRMRRSEFNKNLLDAATIDRSVPGTVVAKVQPEDIFFSHGAQTIAATMAANPTVAASSVSISLTLADATLAGKYGERVVVAVIDPSDKAGYSMLKYADVAMDNTTAQTVSINLGTDMADESLVCIYRLPYRLTEVAAATRTETLANNGSDIITKLISSGSAVQDWGESTLAYTELFTRA
jgi:hypothetical protein